MSKVSLAGNASGTGIFTIASPNSNTDRTLTLPDNTGTVVTTGSTAAVTQSMLAAGVAGNGPAFSARASANQSITSGVWTKVTLDTELFDTNNNFASNRFTPTVAGYYQINGQISVYGQTTQFAGSFYKNGASDNQFFLNYDNATARSSAASGSYVVYLNGTTDYIELYGIQYSGGTVQFEAGGTSFACKMSGALVRAA